MIEPIIEEGEHHYLIDLKDGSVIYVRKGSDYAATEYQIEYEQRLEQICEAVISMQEAYALEDELTEKAWLE